MLGYRNKPAYRYPKGSLKKVVRLACNGKIGSVVKFALKDPSMKSEVISKVGDSMRKELKSFCSNTFNSVLVETSQAALEYFSWESMWQEMAKATPVIMSLFSTCLSHQADKAKLKPIICMCTAILAKSRNPKLCLVQSIISLILLAGHASKQVSIYIYMYAQYAMPRFMLKLN